MPVALLPTDIGQWVHDYLCRNDSGGGDQSGEWSRYGFPQVAFDVWYSMREVFRLDIAG